MEEPMAEKEPLFTVTDRRKFTSEGEYRPGVVASEVPPPQATPAPQDPTASPALTSQGASETIADQASLGNEAQKDAGEFEEDGELQLPEPTAQESADQHAAYKESSKSLDELIAQQNPRAKAPGEMTFDRLVQSVYMTAAIQLGAGGQPGEQPRVDILGARQSIDMLTVLTEKTRGNLTPNETRLLQNALFELRMSFLEITNAIAASAAQGPPPPGMGAPARPGLGGRR
jgi:hypothetical protein